MAERSDGHNSQAVGGGFALLAAAVQASSTVWPERIKPHPYLFWILVAFSTACILAPTASKWWIQLRDRAASKNIDEIALEIIFEPLNPARRFWSMESHFDEHNKLIGTFWEHRIEVRNISPTTLRNVTITVERTGTLPEKPYRALFARTKTDSCDINPGCSELAVVVRWPIQKRQVGFLSGDSAWGYGPIEVIASAENVSPTKAVFDFNYETERMLFERVRH